MRRLIVKLKYKKQKLIYKAIVICRLTKLMIIGIYRFVRSQSQLTKIFGPKYSRSHRSIEIDVTYLCNLRCPNCNRSCGHAPSKEEMTIEQIEEFIKESSEKNIKWKQIKILGGEPTLHTKFFIIIELLLTYKNDHNPDLHIVVGTNGFGNRVKKVLSKLPECIEVENTSKDFESPIFFPFNMAPKDSILYKNVDYSNGCPIAAKDGIGLTPYGYYPCAIAGGIDRIFGFGVGRGKIPSHNDSMIDQLKIFCRLCGHFKFSLPTKRAKVSNSWKVAYELYNEQNAVLNRVEQFAKYD